MEIEIKLNSGHVHCVAYLCAGVFWARNQGNHLTDFHEDETFFRLNFSKPPINGLHINLFYSPKDKEGCNRGQGLSAAIKLGTPEPKFLKSGRKLTCSQ